MQETLNISLDLCDALTRAHRLGVVHRDIKPGNVLISENGTPHLSDFGLALLADSTSLTKSGTLMGTVNYLSPEACNARPLDEKSDIWSFGVMIWEMLTGYPPFQRENIGATLTAILNDPLPNFLDVYSEAPEALAFLLQSMLEKQRSQRLSPMRLVGMELDTILDHLQGEGKPVQESTSWLTKFPLDTDVLQPPSEPTSQEVADSILRSGAASDKQILNKTSLVYIYDNRYELNLDVTGYKILLRSSLFYGEPFKTWLEELSSAGEAEGTLYSFYKSYPRPEVRRRIVKAFQALPCSQAAEKLSKIATTDDSAKVRAEAGLAAAACGMLREVMEASVSQAKQGDAGAQATLVALADQYGIPDGLKGGIRWQTGLAVGFKRWQRYRGDIWRRTWKVARNGGLLGVYGAAVPIIMRYTVPEVYDQTLTYLSLTAYFLISVIMFLILGALQGAALGLSTSLGDTLLTASRITRLRSILAASAGIISGLYFSATQLLGSDPVPAAPGIVLLVNLFYGLILGWLLSLVIPKLNETMSRNQLSRRIVLVVVVNILVSIPHIYIIFQESIGQILFSRLILAMAFPIAIGFPFLFEASHDRE